VLFLERISGFVSAIIPFALMAILAMMAFGERGKKRILLGLGVIGLSGLLGILGLRSGLPLQQPLFCLATGFFGASILVDSITRKSILQKQTEKGFFIEKGRLAKNALLALFGGLFVLYAAYYQKYTQDFITGGKELSLMFGAINTVLLLCSSFAVGRDIGPVPLLLQGQAKAFTHALFVVYNQNVCHRDMNLTRDG